MIRIYIAKALVQLASSAIDQNFRRYCWYEEEHQFEGMDSMPRAYHIHGWGTTKLANASVAIAKRVHHDAAVNQMVEEGWWG